MSSKKDGKSVKKPVLVLGGEGFLGKQVMALLSAQNIHAVSLSRRTGCDLRALPIVIDQFKNLQPSTIINCAAQVGSLHHVMEFAADIINDNILINTNMYRAIYHACPKATLINPLSNCTYPGDAVTQYEPEWQAGPVHDSVLGFASTRRLTYALSHSYHHQYGIKSINWLMANAYGPGDHHDPEKVHALNGIIIRMIQAQKAGKKTFPIWGTGTPIREWVYIKDAAKVLVDSIGKPAQIYPVNIAQMDGYSINEVTEKVAAALKYSVKYIHQTDKADGAAIKVLDNREFKKKYPSFRFTPLEKGICETIEYYETKIA